MLETIKSVLFLCRQNICRSIAAEGVFRYIIENTRLEIAVDSAGVQALPDCLPDPEMCSTAALRGYDFSKLRSRVLMIEDFTRFDLILAVDQDSLLQAQARVPAGTMARIELLMDYSTKGGAQEVSWMGTPRGYVIMLDRIEDSCLGLYRCMIGECERLS